MARHPLFWKVKARLVELQLREAEAKLASLAARDLVARALLEADLDPYETYALDEAAETITVVAPEPPAPPSQD